MQKINARKKSHNGGDQRKYAIINFSHFTPSKCAHNMAKRKAVQTLHKKVLLGGTMGEGERFPGVCMHFPRYFDNIAVKCLQTTQYRNMKSGNLLQRRRIMAALLHLPPFVANSY